VRYGSELNVIAVQADANAMGCVWSPLALTMKEWKNQVLQENPIMHSSWRSRAICLAALAVIVPFVLSLSAAGQTIVIDGESKGRIFDGVGAISGGGGNSRLLIDYPEPYRSQILDYLFSRTTAQVCRFSRWKLARIWTRPTAPKRAICICGRTRTTGADTSGG